METTNYFEVLVGLIIFLFLAWLIWQLKKLEGFIDDYDYRRYKKKK